MRVLAVRSATRCAVCHDGLDEEAVACARCAARAHLDCWLELGRCTSLGCGAAPFARRRLVLRFAPRRWPGVVCALAFLAVLVSVAVHQLHRGGAKSRVGRIQADMKAIGDALDLFKVDLGYYPDRLDALWQRPADAKRWGPEAYLKEYPPKDPWGNPYVFRYEGGKRFEIVSLGADGTPGCTCVGCDLSSRTINDP